MNLLAAIILASGHACGPREDIIQSLTVKHQEQVAIAGFNSSFVYEFWYSPLKDTWTITRVDDNGIMCIMASGTGIIMGKIGAPA